MDRVIFVRRGALNPAQVKQLKNAGVVAIQLDDPSVISEAVTVPVFDNDGDLLDAALAAGGMVGGNFYHYFGKTIFERIQRKRAAERERAKAKAAG